MYWEKNFLIEKYITYLPGKSHQGLIPTLKNIMAYSSEKKFVQNDNVTVIHIHTYMSYWSRSHLVSQKVQQGTPKSPSIFEVGIGMALEIGFERTTNPTHCHIHALRAAGKCVLLPLPFTFLQSVVYVIYVISSKAPNYLTLWSAIYCPIRHDDILFSIFPVQTLRTYDDEHQDDDGIPSEKGKVEK